MKQIYLLSIVGMVFIAASIPQCSSAQCTCSGGIPATTLVYTASISPTNLPSATVSFPQFNPTLTPGFDLSCVTLFDTLSGVSTTGLRNLNSSTALLDPSNPLYSPTGRMEYSMLLNVTTSVIGPGINQNKTFTSAYGPDSLGAYGQPDDSITYGPDNIFTNFKSSKASTSVSSYIGTGSVTFSYGILGGLVITEGSLNYHAQIITTYSGNFGLKYFLCPSSPLATAISYFAAIRNKNTIDLQWLAGNFQNNTVYEIEFSRNGEDFNTLGNIPSNPSSAGTITEFHYQYNLHSSDVGNLYFRIKRVDADGRISYSAVKLVNLESAAAIGIQTYPNPVINTVRVQFEENQNGQFLLEMINIAGQVIQQKSVTLSSANRVDFDLARHPAKGLYVLRAKDITHNKQYITKVQVQ
jgi:Secretion system C-terminal sorting domain